MEHSPENKDFELICLIVNFGIASKVVKVAKHNGISGGTIFLGKGTIKNRLLEFLEIQDVRKEIVLMIAEKSLAYSALEELNSEFQLYKPNHGIAFTTSVSNLLGTRSCKYNESKERRGVESIMYNAIFVVVDKGKAEGAIEAAVKAGSKGGTIINARGSGIHETNTVFSMEIEPEKEIALIISESKSTEAIVDSIRVNLKIDEPGNGIIFIQDINKTYGLY
jgi:nitrogen regulatory protein PII